MMDLGKQKWITGLLFEEMTTSHLINSYYFANIFNIQGEIDDKISNYLINFRKTNPRDHLYMPKLKREIEFLDDHDYIEWLVPKQAGFIRHEGKLIGIIDADLVING